MYKLIIVLATSIIFSMNVFASYPVDIYGTSQDESNLILNEYAKEIAELSKFIISAGTKEYHDKTEEKKILDAWIRIENLKKEIKERYHFLYVNFSIIVYFNKKHNYFTTVEVVSADNPKRLHFIQNKNIDQLPHKNIQKDLIDTMIQFNKIEVELLKNKNLKSTRKKCATYHCSPGFTHPKLKHYLKLFNVNAIKQKKLILDTLKNDLDVERRAAAIFLVGHFSNPNEIISILLPYVKDKDNHVRNNAMLIIVTTMELAQIHQIDTSLLHDFLESPYATDRNKALGILSEVVESALSKRNVIQNEGEKLIDLLQLQQPNNHDLAYIVLKKISGKDFGEYNIPAWRNWISQAKKSSKPRI